MAKPLIDALRKAGRSAELAREYVVQLARPTRSPFVLTELARLRRARPPRRPPS